MFLYIPILAVSESIWTTMHLEILFWECVLVYTLKNELVRYTVRCTVCMNRGLIKQRVFRALVHYRYTIYTWRQKRGRFAFFASTRGTFIRYHPLLDLL
jgi:hypothetical protein